MNLRPIVELGVAEAYAILSARPGAEDLPPLDAIENEDWGRDWLLSRFEAIPADELAALGLRWEDGGDVGPGDQSG
jgi:hypothetical protein